MSDGTSLVTTAAFTITTPSTTAKLDANRKASVAFTVTNASIQPLKGRARVVVLDGAKPEWLAVDGDAERAFASSGTQQYAVQINVPATAPAGKYKFQLKVVGVANPDEQYGESDQVAFEVPQPVKPSVPLPMWIWIVAALVALLVLGGGGFALYKALNPDKAMGTFSPANLSFDKQDIGTTSKAKTITLTNSGSADLRLQAAALSGAGIKDFQLSNDQCSKHTIKAKASCGIDVAFAPLTVGSPTAKWSLRRDLVSEPEVWSRRRNEDGDHVVGWLHRGPNRLSTSADIMHASGGDCAVYQGAGPGANVVVRIL